METIRLSITNKQTKQDLIVSNNPQDGPLSSIHMYICVYARACIHVHSHIYTKSMGQEEPGEHATSFPSYFPL